MSSRALVVALCVLASPALAGGVLLSLEQLPPEAASALSKQLAAARASDPAAFGAVARVYAAANGLDESKRGPLAPLSRALKPLGPAALMPMLELAAVRVPEGPPLTPSAALSLGVGLLEAIGAQRDARAAPVLWGVVSRPGLAAELTTAAAEAYGFLQTEEVSARLLGRVGEGGALTPSQRAVLAGVGSCRVASLAAGLTKVIARARSDEDRLAFIRAYADLGNAWAWRTPGAVAKADEQAVRQRAAQALLQLYVSGSPAVRQAASNALMVVDAPGTAERVRALRERKTGEEAAALDALAQRLARNPTRSP